jgi:hypothetical protein
MIRSSGISFTSRSLSLRIRRSFFPVSGFRFSYLIFQRNIPMYFSFRNISEMAPFDHDPIFRRRGALGGGTPSLFRIPAI